MDIRRAVFFFYDEKSPSKLTGLLQRLNADRMGWDINQIYKELGMKAADTVNQDRQFNINYAPESTVATKRFQDVNGRLPLSGMRLLTNIDGTLAKQITFQKDALQKIPSYTIDIVHGLQSLKDGGTYPNVFKKP